jgi:hypothetical protein
VFAWRNRPGPGDGDATAPGGDWKPSPGEAKTFYDADFMRVDQSSGLIVVRIAEGRPNGPYKAGRPARARSCCSPWTARHDKWIDLGMDFSGDQGLPKGWRKGEKIEDIKGAAGGAGRVACETKDTLPKVALP